MNILTMAEVSALTRLPISTLRYYRSKGVGPPSFRMGRRVVYDEDDVLDWVQGHRDNADHPRTVDGRRPSATTSASSMRSRSREQVAAPPPPSRARELGLPRPPSRGTASLAPKD